VTFTRRIAPLAHRIDHAVGHLTSRREVLVELRTPVYYAVLGPVAEALTADRDVRVWYTSEQPERVRSLVRSGRFLSRAEAEWRRFDLYMNADPWAPTPLRRCAHRLNFFHGVAGKYDLDEPKTLPLEYERYDRVAFVNRDRMRRYLNAGIVSPAQAVLVGYPKLDRLASGGYDGVAVRADLGLEPGRPTAMYAPTYSDASSLHLAGEEVVRTLVRTGFNVIVKLHDRSLDSDPRYNAGIDWRARFAAIEAAAGRARVRFSTEADSSPLLAAADIMVTDHSSIGFEFLVLDRPLIVFDAPDLAATARINPEKIALLRSAATVVKTCDDLAAQAASLIAAPQRLSTARRRVARDLFFDPGCATGRAVNLVRGLLYGDSVPATVDLAVKRETV
jgi:CDP-glycerol glycerophosphotransferase (TagB/SpsB family)